MLVGDEACIGLEQPDIDSLIKATETSGKRQPFRALASSYLASYAPDRPRIEEISSLLTRLAGGMGKPWAPLHDDLNLFHFVEGPNNLARLAVERSISPTEVLTGYGLAPQCAVGIRQTLHRKGVRTAA